MAVVLLLAVVVQAFGCICFGSDLKFYFMALNLKTDLVSDETHSKPQIGLCVHDVEARS